MKLGQVRTIKKLKVNERIRSKDIRLISETGEQLGIVSLDDAKNIAEEKGFDVVEVSPNSKPPVCRLMDYGKFSYQQSKKDRDARKKTKTPELKEIKMRPKIGEHDLQVKIKAVNRLLTAGDKVKVTIIFRGRELAHTDMTKDLFDKITLGVAEAGTIEAKAKLEGKNMVMIFAPLPHK